MFAVQKYFEIFHRSVQNLDDKYTLVKQQTDWQLRFEGELFSVVFTGDQRKGIIENLKQLSEFYS